jgi:CubicO group peptidase (beta-lactamase class C family)
MNGADLLMQTLLANGVDLVLGFEFRFGMGYGLGSRSMPLGPRAGFWGGFGGSLVMVDQDADLTVCYAMNRMHGGDQIDVRGGTLLWAAAAARAEG